MGFISLSKLFYNYSVLLFLIAFYSHLRECLSPSPPPSAWRVSSREAWISYLGPMLRTGPVATLCRLSVRMPLEDSLAGQQVSLQVWTPVLCFLPNLLTESSIKIAPTGACQTRGFDSCVPLYPCLGRNVSLGYKPENDSEECTIYHGFLLVVFVF